MMALQLEDHAAIASNFEDLFAAVLLT